MGKNVGKVGIKKNVVIEKFNEGSLQKHFKKHVMDRAEWGAECNMSIDQYLTKAKELLNSPIGENIDGFVSQNGFIFRYNKLTNEFATAKPDGTIETLFRPKGGMNYWSDQMKVYKPKA